MKRLRAKYNKALARGFTLVEMVMVMVILSIVSLGVTNFIGTSTQIYIDTAGRDEIIAKSRFTVERLNRDIRYALPNSLRVSSYSPGATFGVTTHCLEYFPIEWSTFYLDIATGSETPSSEIRGPDMVSARSSNSYDDANANTHYVVVYPTEDSQVYVNDVTTGTGRIVGVSSVSAADSSNLRTVTFDDAMVFDQESTVERFYIVSDPISYCLSFSNGSYNLWKLSDYGIHPTQIANMDVLTISHGATKILMAEGLANDIRNIDNAALNNSTVFDEAPFRVDNANLQRNSIVHTFFKFERNDEVVAFNNEIHLRNSP